jgi:hypothetical protein
MMMEGNLCQASTLCNGLYFIVEALMSVASRVLMTGTEMSEVLRAGLLVPANSGPDKWKPVL